MQCESCGKFEDTDCHDGSTSDDDKYLCEICSEAEGETEIINNANNSDGVNESSLLKSHSVLTPPSPSSEVKEC
jgi:hypothetical protein